MRLPKSSRNEGTLEDRYAICLACADDGNGRDATTSTVPEQRKPLKTFAEWLAC